MNKASVLFFPPHSALWCFHTLTFLFWLRERHLFWHFNWHFYRSEFERWTAFLIQSRQLFGENSLNKNTLLEFSHSRQKLSDQVSVLSEPRLPPLPGIFSRWSEFQRAPVFPFRRANYLPGDGRTKLSLFPAKNCKIDAVTVMPQKPVQHFLAVKSIWEKGTFS